MAMAQTAFRTRLAFYHHRTAVASRMQRAEMPLFQAFLRPSSSKVTDGLCIKDTTTIDSCCGSGGMFVQSAKFIQSHSGNRGNISVYGQESNADTWKMAKMNMAIRGIDADFGPYHADTFFNKTLKADFIMANPLFNLSNWGDRTSSKMIFVGNTTLRPPEMLTMRGSST